MRQERLDAWCVTLSSVTEETARNPLQKGRSSTAQAPITILPADLSLAAYAETLSDMDGHFLERCAYGPHPHYVEGGQTSRIALSLLGLLRCHFILPSLPKE